MAALDAAVEAAAGVAAASDPGAAAATTPPLARRIYSQDDVVQRYIATARPFPNRLLEDEQPPDTSRLPAAGQFALDPERLDPDAREVYVEDHLRIKKLHEAHLAVGRPRRFKTTTTTSRVDVVNKYLGYLQATGYDMRKGATAIVDAQAMCGYIHFMSNTRGVAHATLAQELSIFSSVARVDVGNELPAEVNEVVRQYDNLASQMRTLGTEYRAVELMDGPDPLPRSQTLPLTRGFVQSVAAEVQAIPEQDRHKALKDVLVQNAIVLGLMFGDVPPCRPSTLCGVGMNGEGGLWWGREPPNGVQRSCGHPDCQNPRTCHGAYCEVVEGDLHLCVPHHKTSRSSGPLRLLIPGGDPVVPLLRLSQGSPAAGEEGEEARPRDKPVLLNSQLLPMSKGAFSRRCKEATLTVFGQAMTPVQARRSIATWAVEQRQPRWVRLKLAAAMGHSPRTQREVYARGACPYSALTPLVHHLRSVADPSSATAWHREPEGDDGDMAVDMTDDEVDYFLEEVGEDSDQEGGAGVGGLMACLGGIPGRRPRGRPPAKSLLPGRARLLVTREEALAMPPKWRRALYRVLYGAAPRSQNQRWLLRKITRSGVNRGARGR